MRDITSLMQKCMDTAVERKEVAGINGLVIRDGKEIAYAESGEMKRDTIVRLYSQSKPVTAAATMTLVQDGIIDLFEPVGSFIDSFKEQTYLSDGKVKKVPVERPVQILDLLNMTSGLVYPNIFTEAEKQTDVLFRDLITRLSDEDSSKMMTTMEFAERLGEIPLNFAPGSHFQYGTSADILGAVIEKVTGMKFGDYLKEKFFDPLEMKDTGFFVPDEKMDRLSKVYERDGAGLKEYTFDNLGIRNDGKYNAFESGGAGLFSTIDDYAKFGQMLLNGGSYNGKQILTPKAVEFLTHGQLDAPCQKDMSAWRGLEGFTYNHLLRIMVNPDEAGVFGNKGEYGWDGWLGAFFMNDPATNTTFIMLTQMRDFGTGNVTRRLRNIVLS